ncbi:MAG: UDP-N-acetylmuramoyl-L-alanine--D-glutamate ligase [Trueperaceae bacterium]|nr:UDP-N-acetylmuramoyl-L-alanine--D-glutamate ligase [Trueperaceae bacterium]
MSAPLLVYGLGRSGGAVVARARAEGEEVVFVDARAQGDDVDAAERLGARRVADAAAALRLPVAPTTCVAAPGVPIDHPDLVALRATGVEVIGEVVWLLRRAPAPTIGITGTAGKGTVTRWTADVLLAAGIEAVAGGNLDPALSAVARPGATLVVELSSFQLERAPGLRPDVAVVLNLGVDHLDRHGDLATYHAAKHHLVRDLGPDATFVANADDPLVAAWAARSRARVRRFSLAADAGADAWWDRAGGHLMLDGRPLVRADELRVRGPHLIADALAVALAADAMGAPRAAIAAGLRAFGGLPGRHVEVGRLGGVRFVDDSIATRPLAVEAALRACDPPVVWLAGGVDKGAEVGALAEALRDRVVLTLGIGASGRAYADAAAAFAAAEVAPSGDGAATLAWAVRRAYGHLRDAHDGHGTVLLAPLAASFDQFRDYAHRGGVFRDAVTALAAATATEEGVVWTPSS